MRENHTRRLLTERDHVIAVRPPWAYVQHREHDRVVVWLGAELIGEPPQRFCAGSVAIILRILVRFVGAPVALVAQRLGDDGLERVGSALGVGHSGSEARVTPYSFARAAGISHSR